MSSYARAIDLGVQGVEATIRTKRSKRFKQLPRLLGSHELSLYWLFRRASISVDPGDCVVVAAEDPQVSTAFMRSMCGLLPADEGVVQGDSRSIMVSTPATRTVNGLSVRQAVQMVGGLYGLSDQEIEDRADAVIDMAQVKAVLNERIEETPRTIRQQIAFSWAMVAPVDILAFSGRPVVGGPEFQSECARRLAEQTRTGRALLISTADAGLVRALGTKGIVLDEEESTPTPVESLADELERRAKARKRAGRERRRRAREAEGEEDDTPGF